MKDIKCAIDWDRVKNDIISREKIGKTDKRSDILQCLDECLDEASSMSSPKYAYTEKKILRSVSGKIGLNGGLDLMTGSVSSSIVGADHVCIFLVTIGDALESRSSRLMAEGDHLKGYLLDRIGSFAVESLAHSFEEKFRGICHREKKSVSIRFSPGYCDWAIEEQYKLDKLLDFSKAGVILNKSCMMAPKKSISAIVGIGPEGLFSRKYSSPCHVCSKKDCDYRRSV
jgi:hypothetical protein